IEMIEVEEFHQGTLIKVIGVGGGGGNAVEHMISRAVQGVEFICANTDAQALSRSSATKQIQLGASGLGAGSKPDKGRDSAHATDGLKTAVGGIAQTINVPGHVNVDFEDVRTVMGEPGKAMMGTAIASGPDRARIAAEQAVACPLLEGIDLSGAKGVLVLIT